MSKGAKRWCETATCPNVRCRPALAHPVQVPHVRDRSGQGIRFHTLILPPYMRRSRSIEELLPGLYVKGASTGDFAVALQALLGPNAPGLSASTISRLKESWQEERKVWQGGI